MEIKLTAESAPVNSNLIMMFDEFDTESLGFLSGEELLYAQNEFESDKNLVFINRYSNWIILYKMKNEQDNAKFIEGIRATAATLTGFCNEKKIEEVHFDAEFAEEPEILAFAEGFILADYKFLKYRSDREKKQSPLKSLTICSNTLSRQALERMLNITAGTMIARDLVNEPIIFLNTHKISDILEKLAFEAGFEIEIWNKKQIEKEGMGGLLAVNKGSVDPPRFCIMRHRPENPVNGKPLVLVGKGVLYDTGGMSLKPGPAMETMKSDMGGSAAVIGAMYSLAKNNVDLDVIALIPFTDNRVDANAYCPGDIIKMHDGTFVEVLNTDAEGRMVLADALSYAKRFEPLLAVTLATLTGASRKIAGHFSMSGMRNDPASELMDIMKSAGNEVFERIIELPLWEEYGEMLKSDVADLKNVGGEIGGMITAGKFLEHFTDYPFIHLDIAGPAFIKSNDKYRPKGGTGWGVRILSEFISQLEQKLGS